MFGFVCVGVKVLVCVGVWTGGGVVCVGVKVLVCVGVFGWSPTPTYLVHALLPSGPSALTLNRVPSVAFIVTGEDDADIIRVDPVRWIS